MDPAQIAVTIVVALLGGGIVGAIGSLIVGRATARKTIAEAQAIDRRLPAEVDSVVVQGAEAAVLTMERALESATGRIRQLEQERDADRARIRELEAKVERLQQQVEAAEQSLAVARREGAEVRDELAAFIREQDARK